MTKPGSDGSSEMDRLIFGEGLLAPTLTGGKCNTFRKYRKGSHDFKAGQYFKGEFKDGLTIVLRMTADTTIKPCDAITDEEARENGFTDASTVFEGLREYYTDLKPADQIAILRFEVPQIEGVPIVGFNEHAT